MTRTVHLVLLGVLLAASPLPAAAFERTEKREPCAQHDPLRRPFFGDTHVHTAFSFDAHALGTRNTPRDAYRFARGERIGIQPFDEHGRPLRSAQLDRPLDFAAVTDHAEMLGEVRICQTPGMAGHDSFICRLTERWPLLSYIIVNSAIFDEANPHRYSFCGPAGESCRTAALGPWREIQAAAEEAYDRSGRCSFTTFVGYEWSGNPDSNMIHRNVIFRNEIVQEVPTNYIDTRTGEELWETLYAQCLELENGCDVLAIPHNSNLSGGMLFPVETEGGRPIDAETARRRSRLERLVEIFQHKGSSECRGEDPFAVDELCAFERLPFAAMAQYPIRAWWKPAPPLSYVREVLGEGLVQERRIGVNPFKLGVIGSTDTHLGTPGFVSKGRFLGHAAGGDTSRTEVPLVPDRLFFNPGGLAVLWAEENSRDALFEAMLRREAYGTSGPRIVVRFFGGWDYPDELCGRQDFAAVGYANGVPMGADLPAPAATAAPVFALSALRDAGTSASPGGLLQRVQVVKVWLEEGEPRTRVYDVAGDPDSHATVDLDTCEPTGEGFDTLCALWRDPDFSAGEPALYYARVLENPSCRWPAFICRDRGVHCDDPRAAPSALAYCCDGSTALTVQERAWTSPIWYTPPAATADPP